MTASITFPITAAVICAALWALSATGHELVPGHDVENWLAQGAFTALYALFAGVLVDALRWLLGVAWRSADPHAAGRIDATRV